MQEKMTITLDEDVCEVLYRTVGKRRISQFIEDLRRPYVRDTLLNVGYRAMAKDMQHEAIVAEASAHDRSDVAR